LTKLDAVVSYGFKAVRDARKELVDKIERELEKQVVKALVAGEEEEKVEEKVGETIDGEEVEKVVVEDVHMEDRPSVAPTEALEASETSV